jgi:lipid II:glycine glycyltransferase (peptidoglycan interpeptide bridge formation enzyme)
MSVRLRPTQVADLHVPNNFMQSPLWAHTKRKQGFTVLSLDGRWERDRRVRTFQLLVVEQPVAEGARLAYLPWAPPLPVPEEQQGRLLEEMALALKAHVHRDTVAIRFDVPWESPWHAELRLEAESPATSRGARILPNVRPAVRTRELRLNFGTETHTLRKAPTNVQPTDTLVVDLLRSDAALLAQMHPKTRYNIRLASRRGVTTRLCSPSELETWYRLYRETMTRNRTRVHAFRHFRGLLDSQRELTGTAPADGSSVHLLMATKGGMPLAGMILAIQDRYAMYLYGASADAGRTFMAPHQLQWEAMRLARSLGCKWYDMFGIPSDSCAGNPMHGLLRFKRGFGGRHIARLGCWDYPLQGEAYRQVAALQGTDTGYHGT